MRASLLVLNFNGLRLLDGCFETLGEATGWGARHDVYLVDNGSTDRSIDHVADRFPWVKAIRMPANRFLYAFNDVVPKLETEAVLLLNNDILVDPGFVDPLVEHLAKPDVFAVNTKILSADRKTSQFSRCGGGFRKGLWYIEFMSDLDRPSTSFFGWGGQAAFSRSKFMELGGFDKLLWPLYHEDIDLSMRAWRRGWRVLCEPSSVLYHLGGATSSKVYESSTIASIVWKNTFLIQWKNIDDPRMRAEHLAWIPRGITRGIVKRQPPLLRGLAAAVPRWGAANARRREQAAMHRLSNRDAFDRLMAGIEGSL